MMNEIHFLQPYWLIGLIAPLLWLRIHRHRALHWPQLLQPLALRYPALSVLRRPAERSADGSTNRWFGAVLLLLMFSLAQPVRYGHSLPTAATPEPVDLILVVNTSVSMVLRDNLLDGKQLDRMSMTRELLLELIEQFKGQRIGLVLLGRPASIWLPLTPDRRLVRQAIERLQTTLGGRSSDIAATLELVRSGFKPDTGDEPARHSSPVVLLISDGDQQLGAIAPEDAIKKLVSEGFQLHSLAIGSTARPEYSLGKGHLVYSAVDLALLDRLAAAGGGQMVHGRSRESITQLLDLLSKPASPAQRNNDRKRLIPLYPYPLLLALLLILLQLLPWPAILSRRSNS